MKIGEVASQAGVIIDTVRYYERRGLLAEPERRPSGYREYPPDTIRIIRFIRRAQDLGFTLDEIEELLTLRNGQSTSRREVRRIAASKLQDIDQKLAQLQAMRSALYGLMDSCECGNGANRCPILDALDDASRPEPVRKPRKKNGKN